MPILEPHRTGNYHPRIRELHFPDSGLLARHSRWYSQPQAFQHLNDVPAANRGYPNQQNNLTDSSSSFARILTL
jgi:hypothetical protein